MQFCLHSKLDCDNPVHNISEPHQALFSKLTFPLKMFHLFNG